VELKDRKTGDVRLMLLTEAVAAVADTVRNALKR